MAPDELQRLTDERAAACDAIAEYVPSSGPALAKTP
jgi:hypothetical protein